MIIIEEVKVKCENYLEMNEVYFIVEELKYIVNNKCVSYIFIYCLYYWNLSIKWYVYRRIFSNIIRKYWF